MHLFYRGKFYLGTKIQRNADSPPWVFSKGPSPGPVDESILKVFKKHLPPAPVSTGIRGPGVFENFGPQLRVGAVVTCYQGSKLQVLVGVVTGTPAIGPCESKEGRDLCKAALRPTISGLSPADHLFESQGCFPVYTGYFYSDENTDDAYVCAVIYHVHLVDRKAKALPVPGFKWVPFDSLDTEPWKDILAKLKGARAGLFAVEE